jgi:hypothetical protein
MSPADVPDGWTFGDNLVKRAPPTARERRRA